MNHNPIIVALDGISHGDALVIAKKLKDYVWGFKVNDIAFSQGEGIIGDLEDEGVENIMLDFKWHDIPNTVQNAAAHFVKYKSIKIATVHASGGKEMITAAVNELHGKIAAVTVLTSIDQDMCFDIYGGFPEIKVAAFAFYAQEAGASLIVCSGQELSQLHGISLPKIVPGIRPLWYQEQDDQKRKMTPSEAISNGAGYLVMGRPILRAEDPVEAAKRTLEEIENAGRTN